MAQEGPLEETPARSARRRFGCWALLALLVVLIAAFAAAWLNRKEIADDLIADTLDAYGIEHSYTIESIGPRRQVLSDIVIGDPARPDLTIERAEITVRPRFGIAAIESIRLVRPRLFGSYRAGKLSFGQLDPLIFPETREPFEFPAFDLAVEDGRGLLETDYGPVGVKLAGKGYLLGGFEGELAAIAPRLQVHDCGARRVSLYGSIAIDAERPRFAGPLRIEALECPDSGMTTGKTAVALDLRGDRDLAGVEGTGKLDGRGLAMGTTSLARLGGEARFAFRDGGLTAQYDVAGENLAASPVSVAGFTASGAVRARDGFGRIELESKIDGREVALGKGAHGALASLARSSDGTLLAPLAQRIRRELDREGRGSQLSAEFTMRGNAESLGLVMPAASLRGGSGATLLSLSRFQVGKRSGENPRFSGNFSTGGAGLPRIAGRMEERPSGGLALRLTMAPYEAGNASIALPGLVILQRGDGALGFSGEVLANGPLPGGLAEGLRLPVSGNVSPAGALSIWRECTDISFERLALADVSFGRQTLTLCPPRGGEILRQDRNGLRLAAGAPSLRLSGSLGESPIAIDSGPVGIAWPGSLFAQRLNITIGPAATAAQFAVGDLRANLGEKPAGTFAGADVRIAAIPLNVNGANGRWRYANGQLALTEGAFELADREQQRRFEPLIGRDATLTLRSNLIEAQVVLREPRSDRAVTRVDVAHDLSTGAGSADIAVEGLRFDRGLQPSQLTARALGVVANVEGAVNGSGRVDWNEQGIASHGVFATESLDLAAEFGPVQGISGTITFTDLLGLTTAPDQRINLALMNPGIEVFEGEISYALNGGEFLQVNSGKWPFLGGTLAMRPITIHVGASEDRRFIFDIQGLDAALFVDRMELNNLAATGIFDGSIPIVFDKDGNGSLEGGVLRARPPGGNVSYVGDLTYQDITPIANFAFASLRSLDYREMEVLLDGSLTGEIVTRVRLDGVKQGKQASSNIITRQLGKLPLRFVVNIRAPFYSLITSVRALYDPAAIRDPRELGLIDEKGRAVQQSTSRQSAVPPSPSGLPSDEAPIQRPESENVR